MNGFAFSLMLILLALVPFLAGESPEEPNGRPYDWAIDGI